MTMKKIVVIALLFALQTQLYARWYDYSDSLGGMSGGSIIFMQLETFLDTQNEQQVVSKWREIQQGNVAKLLDKLETKQKHLNNIKSLKKEQDVEQLHNIFEANQRKQLNTIKVDSWSIEK
jgi:prephenate dehydrogenase